MLKNFFVAMFMSLSVSVLGLVGFAIHEGYQPIEIDISTQRVYVQLGKPTAEGELERDRYHLPKSEESPKIDSSTDPPSQPEPGS